MSKTRKIINDPVFGFLSIPDGVLFEILQHPYVQRLNRIRQLGLSFFVYPGAMHSRFVHSLGAMHLMQKYRFQIQCLSGLKMMYSSISKNSLFIIFSSPYDKSHVNFLVFPN